MFTVMFTVQTFSFITLLRRVPLCVHLACAGVSRRARPGARAQRRAPAAARLFELEGAGARRPPPPGASREGGRERADPRRVQRVKEPGKKPAAPRAVRPVGVVCPDDPASGSA